MRILIVEDDDDTATDLEFRLRQRLSPIMVVRAVSVADATTAIASQTFDAAIVDLRIPEEPGGATRLVDYGKLVDARIADHQPGAARIFLTASDLEEVKQQLRMSIPGDHFATGETISLVDHVLKEGTAQLQGCVEFVATHVERLSALDEVRLEGADDFDPDDRRAFALTVRIAGGHSGRIAKRSGFSTCRTAVVECFDIEGHNCANAFCKVGPPAAIARERAGYDRVRFSLPSTALPTLARELFVGIGPSRALVFTIAPTTSSLFDIARDDIGSAETCVRSLADVLQPLAPAPPGRTLSFAELRRTWIKPVVETRFADEIASLGLDRLEAEGFELLVHRQHGDLHGENILVVGDSSPFLIDFAYTDEIAGPVDPVSLELSFLFHENSPLLESLEGQPLDDWWEGDFLTRTGHFGQFAGACRDWSRSLGHDERSYALVTLLYSLWILEHTPNSGLALGIAAVAVNRLVR